MTREEAINIVQGARQYLTAGNPIWDTEKVDEAMKLAIEALSAKPNKAVPPSLADVYKWERDIALSQLEEYGICFGEKKRDDLVEVVRCKDCKWWGGNKNTEHNNHICNRALNQNVDYWTRANDFCSYGERIEK